MFCVSLRPEGDAQVTMADAPSGSTHHSMPCGAAAAEKLTGELDADHLGPTLSALSIATPALPVSSVPRTPIDENSPAGSATDAFALSGTSQDTLPLGVRLALQTYGELLTSRNEAHDAPTSPTSTSAFMASGKTSSSPHDRLAFTRSASAQALMPRGTTAAERLTGEERKSSAASAETPAEP